MAKTKQEIAEFCSKYVNKQGIGKSFEGITEYVVVDKVLINRDKENIINFFASNFAFSSIIVDYDELRKDENNHIWNEIKTLEDIELLNSLLAIGIASGLFIDEMMTRFNNIISLNNYGNYLNPENFNLQNPIDLANYLEIFKEYVLPNCLIKCNYDLLLEYNDLIFSDEEKKELIDFWWNNCENLPYNEEVFERFNELVEYDLEGVLDLIVVMIIYDEVPANLNMMIQLNQENIALSNSRHVIAELNEEKEQYEKLKKEILMVLKKARETLENKKKHP